MTGNLAVQMDRRLPDRSKLMFYFPNVGGDDYTVVELPFFENISINERKKARYKKYSLISRSSNLYSYLGADSRQFNLNFHLTLPHIIEGGAYLTRSIMNPTAGEVNSSYEKARFSSPDASPGEVSEKSPATRLTNKYITAAGMRDTAHMILTQPGADKMFSPEYRSYLAQRFGVSLFDAFAHDTLPIASLEGGSEPITYSMASHESDTDPLSVRLRREIRREQALDIERLKMIDLIIYWVNIIRTCVTNNTENPLYGPPVLRLTHGIMYQNIPCICLDYKIDWEENMGYDLDTLLPRRIKIGLRLEEFRTGNFEKFIANTSLSDPDRDRLNVPDDAKQSIAGDNLAGWEAVISGGTTDPGYL